jgi:hypothetical protein
MMKKKERVEERGEESDGKGGGKESKIRMGERKRRERKGG